MKKTVYTITFLLLNLSNTFAANADAFNQATPNINHENTTIDDTDLTDDIERYSLEFGGGGIQFQAKGLYRPHILDNKLDLFLRAGFGYMIARNAIGVGSNLEVGGKYFFDDNKYYKILAGYTFPNSHDPNAFYAGIGIGIDLISAKKVGLNLGLDFGSTFEAGKSGIGGVTFLRPEINAKLVF